MYGNVMMKKIGTNLHFRQCNLAQISWRHVLESAAC